MYGAAAHGRGVVHPQWVTVGPLDYMSDAQLLDQEVAFALKEKRVEDADPQEDWTDDQLKNATVEDPSLYENVNQRMGDAVAPCAEAGAPFGRTGLK